MAGGGRSSGLPARGGKGRPARASTGKPAPARKPASGAKKPGSTAARPKQKPASPATAPDTALLPAGPFRLGAIAGATPGKWIDVWKSRLPDHPLTLFPLEAAGQRRALDDGEVDAAIVRLPIARDGLSVIALYDEVTVVVCSTDSALTAVDELTLADLAGEVVITPSDDVLGVDVPDAAAPRFAPPETTGEAVATVAAGVGVVIVPMSLARLHHRKDVDYRPVIDAPTSTVALAWPSAATTPLVEAFVGIVRGRTANSSR